MRIEFIKCHGSGNDFPMIDARAIRLSDAQWGTVARVLANRDGPVGGDGLLLMTPGDADHPIGFRMFNSDGSEAETCINGLRCVARLGFETLGLERAGMRLTNSVADARRAPAIAPGVATVAVRAGPASTDTRAIGLVGAGDAVIDAAIPALPSDLRFTAVAMPNPHLVAFVDAIDEAALVALGQWCESAPPALPRRANVSFVTAAPEGLFVRTFERGVGLTDSCGSAMAAAAHAACRTGRAAWDAPITVRNRGGLVRAIAERPETGGWVTIEGNATFLYDAAIDIDPDSGEAEAPVIGARRDDEAAAWDAARKGILAA